MEVFILIIIGIIGGLVAGSMGVGGGIIFTPVLFFLFDEAGIEHSVQWSVASGLLCTFSAALSSTIRQAINKNIYLKEGIYLGFFGIIGVSLGKWILTSGYYQREQFVVFFSLILFYAAFMMFSKGRNRNDESNNSHTVFDAKSAFMTGGIGGSIATLAGVGGGIIMIPIINVLCKQPFRKTVSISHLGMCFLISVGLILLGTEDVSTSGISAYHVGYIDIGAALPLAFGGAFGANFGTIINHKIHRKYLQWGFTILATSMACSLLWSVFGS